jgi:Tfp pilus assembly protein PilF
MNWKTSLAARFLMVGALSGCSMPQIVRNSDPLSATEHVTLGSAYLEKNERALAVQQYEAALRKDKKYVPALMTLGNIAFEDRQWNQARSYFRRALKASPGNAGALNNLAMVDLAEGKPLDRAVEQVEKALPLAGGMRPYLLDTLANIAIRQGRIADAEIVLEQALAEAPKDNPEFQQHLAESRQRLATATPVSQPKETQ